MFLNVFVMSVVLFIFPACESKCSTFYILIEEYYDDIFGVNSFRPISEKINWDSYTIKLNSTDLAEFKKECVIFMHCNEIEVKQCAPSIPITNRYGVDKRLIVNPAIGTRNNTKNIESDVVLATNNSKTANESKEMNKTHGPLIASSSGSIDGKPTGEPKDGVFGETSKQNVEEKSPKSEALTGKIVAGTIGAAASVAAIAVASKFILGCMQSGVYRVPEPC